jgi:hypothetical protein
MPDGSSDLEKDLEGAAPLLRQTMTRRGMLRITGGAWAGMIREKGVA